MTEENPPTDTEEPAAPTHVDPIAPTEPAPEPVKREESQKHEAPPEGQP